MEKIQQIKEWLMRIRAKTMLPRLSDDTRKQILKMSEEALSLMAEMEKEGQDMHPDTEADGIVFCGKCGKMR
jgi:hypothetical protein